MEAIIIRYKTGNIQQKYIKMCSIWFLVAGFSVICMLFFFRVYTHYIIKLFYSVIKTEAEKVRLTKPIVFIKIGLYCSIFVFIFCTIYFYAISMKMYGRLIPFDRCAATASSSLNYLKQKIKEIYISICGRIASFIFNACVGFTSDWHFYWNVHVKEYIVNCCYFWISWFGTAYRVFFVNILKPIHRAIK